jgi:hypothetical protein
VSIELPDESLERSGLFDHFAHTLPINVLGIINCVVGLTYRCKHAMEIFYSIVLVRAKGYLMSKDHMALAKKLSSGTFPARGLNSRFCAITGHTV